MSLMRGAILSPRHKLAAATPHRGAPPPSSFFRLAAMPLPMFGNDTYGDCVTAEEYTAKAADGHLGTNAEAIATAKKWGGLNGADLSTILQDAKEGFTVGGTELADGSAQTVNYTDWPSLCSAIAEGQVKIAVSANQLESAGAGNVAVWFLLAATLDSSLDHCVGLAGYGTLAERRGPRCVGPSGADSSQQCVCLRLGADMGSSVPQPCWPSWAVRPRPAIAKPGCGCRPR